jgi:predicted glutamine amidotransferase
VRLNFLLSDGETMYAFNHHPEKIMYLTDRQTAGGSSVVITTQTLDSGRWDAMPEDRLLVIRQGRLVAQSDKI